MVSVQRDSYQIEKVDKQLHNVAKWFLHHTRLQPPLPHDEIEPDQWSLHDGNKTIAMALVEDGTLHRLGVVSSRRREGHASTLISHLLDEYGELDVECHESLDANEFFAATGWEQIEKKSVDSETALVWHKSSSDESE